MSFHPSENAEPIPGYRLIKKIGTGGYGEVWEASVPGGLTKAVKIIYGSKDDVRAGQELEALHRIREVRHPFLLSLERVEIIGDQVFIVTELADRSLADRFQECREAGLPGIPRDELLDIFRDAADALDYMNEHYGLQHLDIKPSNLLLVGNRIKIADFGLVKDLKGDSATATGGITAVYAPPEIFDGKVSRHSDQYSLAIVYQEMLTGVRPFPGKTPLQLAAQHLNSPPMLHPLPPGDRPAINRALAKEPAQRFPKCRELVDHLPRTLPENVPTFSPPGQVPTPSAVPPPGSAEEEDLLDQETAVSLDVLQVSTPPQPTPPSLSESRADSSSPGLAQLRPTLFVGVGGFAGLVLRGVRRRLTRRFGPPGRVPLFAFLQLDTDRTGLRLAQQGRPGEGLSPDETLFLPLHRPDHYRTQSREILRWLDRRWLYGIPRSLLTEGLRPLGRLALVTNQADVMARLHDTLEQMTDAAAVREGLASTGLALRESTPRVFVIASLSGGTGSGMALDVGFAVREALAGLGLSDEAVCGLLAFVPGQNPSENELGQTNALATLAELNHFSARAVPASRENGTPEFHSPSGRLSSPPSHAGPAPFPDCYVVNLAKRDGEFDFDSAADSLAEYLFLDAGSRAGGLLDYLRQASVSVTAADRKLEGSPRLRTLGIARLAWPRHELADLVAGRLCGEALSRWLAEPPAEQAKALMAEVRSRIAEWGLDLASVMDWLRGAVHRHLGESPEAYLEKHLRQCQHVQGPGPDGWTALLEKLDELFSPVAAGGSSFVDDTRNRATEHGRELAAKVQQWLAAAADEPGKRLGHARAATVAVTKEVSSSVNAVRSLLQENQEQLAVLRQPAAAREAAGQSSSWFNRRADSPDEAFPGISQLGQLKVQELLLANCLEVLKAFTVRQSDFTRTLLFAVDKVAGFGDSFSGTCPDGSRTPGAVSCPPVRELLPGGAKNFDAAAASLTISLGPAWRSALDVALNAEVFAPHGGVWALVSQSEAFPAGLRDAVWEQARRIVVDGLQTITAAGLFLEQHPDRDQAQDVLERLVRQAWPRLSEPPPLAQWVAAFPAGKEGDAVREMVRELVPESSLNAVTGGGDVVLVLEAGGVPLPTLMSGLVQPDFRHLDYVPQVMTRIDVDWTPLPSLKGLRAKAAR